MPDTPANSAADAGELIAQWEESQRSDSFDPTRILIGLAEIVEREADLYLRKDPDPFDERHPSRADPDSNFGAVLKIVLKKDAFFNKLTGDYMRDNYFGQGNNDKNGELNTHACRLLLDLLPGLDAVVVFSHAESLLQRLHGWAEREIEPISTYAIGLLAAAMEVHELAAANREKTNVLVPRLIQRLIKLQSAYFAVCAEEADERPFAQFTREDDRKRPAPTKTVRQSPAKRLKMSNPNSPRADECSNSSWVEMQPLLIGTYTMYPVGPKQLLEVQQLFILRYLTPMGEYQDLLSLVLKNNVVQLVLRYTDLSVSKYAVRLLIIFKYFPGLPPDHRYECAT
jgi:HIV-1 Vpr-binding protein